MHIFCKYGKWEDLAAVASGGMLIQERRCSVCNKVNRRQTRFLGGSYDRPIASKGFSQKQKSDEKEPPANVTVSGGSTGLTFSGGRIPPPPQK